MKQWEMQKLYKNDTRTRFLLVILEINLEYIER